MRDSDWLPIGYGEFYDVPRLFWIVSGRDAVLFDCEFSDEIDDYPDEYAVYVVSVADLPRPGVPWTLPVGARPLGRAPVGDVTFDASRRQAVRRDAVARFAGL